jgi:hypothetical protein
MGRQNPFGTIAPNNQRENDNPLKSVSSEQIQITTSQRRTPIFSQQAIDNVMRPLAMSIAQGDALSLK